MKKAGVTIGLLLMLTSGVAFVVCLLLTADLTVAPKEEVFTRAQLNRGIIVSAIVFLLSFAVTAFSGFFAIKDISRSVKAQDKWINRL
ncbi:MAG: hypothetical protein ABL959_16605 [Pyrinomonadaceae bacterium]